MTRRKTSRSSQFVAACCLLGLLGTWAPHVHEGPDSAHASEPGRFESADFELSSDDAHGEHSSVRDIAHVNCAMCRSEERCEEAKLSPVYPGCDQTAQNPAYADPTARRTQALFGRLPFTRAPPTDPSA